LSESLTDHPKLNGLGDNKKRKQPCSNELRTDKGAKKNRNQRTQSDAGAELKATVKLGSNVRKKKLNCSLHTAAPSTV